MKRKAKKRFMNTNGDSRLFEIAVVLLFGLFTLLCLFPFYYIFINTISDNELVSQGRILLLPKGIHLQNYVDIFKLRGLDSALFISCARTVLGTALTIFGSTFLGYAFSQTEFWRRKFWYRFVIITMYFNAGIIPWFLTMKALGLLNNFLAYVLPTAVMPFYTILFKTYVESLPRALEESAALEGAGYLTRYLRIVFPLSMPTVATIAVFAAVNQWNTFMDTLFLMSDAKLYSLQFLLYQYLSEINALAETMRNNAVTSGMVNPSKLLTPTSIRMTVSIVVVLPILFIYPFFQRYFMKGIMIGAVKS